MRDDLVTGGTLEVEEARERDAAAILTLHRRVLEERAWFITLPHEFIGTPGTKRQLIRELVRAPNSTFLVAREAGRVLGFATVQGGMLSRMRHVGKLEIMVDPSARGRGAGTVLMRALVAWAIANPELVKLGLNVFADNERAIALYRRFGFEEEGRRLGEYREQDGTLRDDVLMFRRV